jgi:hypothetical protein
MSRPAADETCDGDDNDCDGEIDEGLEHRDWYNDSDGDGYGSGAVVSSTCDLTLDMSGLGRAHLDGDCDESDSDINPGATEVCNEIDDDCDSEIDEGVSWVYFTDIDGDGYGVDDSDYTSCVEDPAMRATVGGDCLDSNADVNPGVPSDDPDDWISYFDAEYCYSLGGHSGGPGGGGPGSGGIEICSWDYDCSGEVEEIALSTEDDGSPADATTDWASASWTDEAELPHVACEDFKDDEYDHPVGDGDTMPVERWFGSVPSCGETGTFLVSCVLDGTDWEPIVETVFMACL